MLVAIDNISTGAATTAASIGGMRMYLHNFVAAMATWGGEHKYVLLSPRWFDSDFASNLPGVVDTRVSNVPKCPTGRVLFEQLKYRRVIYRCYPDVFVALQNSVPFGLRVPSVLLVKSIQYLLFPETFTTVRCWYLRWQIHLSMKTATKVVVPAKAVAADLARVCHVSADKFEVVPEALYISKSSLQAGCEDHKRRLIAAHSHQRPFVLCVGATYPYKNIPRLVKAFARFKREMGSEHVLLIVGAPGGVSFDMIKSYAEDSQVGGDVICTGALPHDQVVAAYQMASMMVMPSLYETFGHPVLEAMACGCPVVTGNVGATNEIASDAAALVDPHDERAIAAAMVRIARDCIHRQELIERGVRRAKEFCWESTASGMLGVLRRAVGASNGPE